MQPIKDSFHQTLLPFDNKFYESPTRYNPDHTHLQVVKKHLLKYGINFEKGEFWTYIKNAKNLPAQGWKIHISANFDNSEEILDIVSNYCLEKKYHLNSYQIKTC